MMFFKFLRESWTLIILYSVIFVNCYDGFGATSTTTTSMTPTLSAPATVKMINRSATNLVLSKDSPAKREVIKESIPVLEGKSYDPPAEFYRGPTSSSTTRLSSSSSPLDTLNHRDKFSTIFPSKPLTFSHGNQQRNRYGHPSIAADSSNKYHAATATDYGNWQSVKGSVSGLKGAYNSQDRISVGHYGSNGINSYGTAATHGENSPDSHHEPSGIHSSPYDAYDTRQYTTPHHQQQHHHIEYVPIPATGHGHAAHYTGSAHGAASNYYAGGAVSNYYTGGTTHNGYNGEGAAGIPFDVYGGKGQYTGAGGEYSYTYPEVHENPVHKEYGEGYGYKHGHKGLLNKHLLIPLAGAAILGITAALVSNPLLLQLGTVSALGPALVGKRKRRDLRNNEVQVVDGKNSDKRLLSKKVDSYDGQALAYRAYNGK